MTFQSPHLKASLSKHFRTSLFAQNGAGLYSAAKSKSGPHFKRAVLNIDADRTHQVRLRETNPRVVARAARR